jgi:hypothetical protein
VTQGLLLVSDVNGFLRKSSRTAGFLKLCPLQVKTPLFG